MTTPVNTEFCGFELTPAKLSALNELGKEEENVRALAALGGVDGVARLLKVDVVKGSSGKLEDVAARQASFGANVVPEPPFESWISLFIGAFDDMVLRILMVASAVSIIVGSIPELAEGATWDDKVKHAKLGWIEGFA